MMATCNNSKDHVPESGESETGEEESNKIDSSTEKVDDTEVNDDTDELTKETGVELESPSVVVDSSAEIQPIDVDDDDDDDDTDKPLDETLPMDGVEEADETPLDETPPTDDKPSEETTPTDVTDVTPSRDAPSVVVTKSPLERRRRGRRHRRRKIGMPRSPRSNNCHSPKAKIAKLDGQADVNGAISTSNADELNDKTNDENDEHSKEPKDVFNSEGTLNARPKRNASIDKKPIIMEMRETRSKTKASEEARIKNSVPKMPDENKPRTIIVTETKSLAQVINNAVRKDGRGLQENSKPTLVIIETKSPSEVITMSTKPSTNISKMITVETGSRKNSSGTTLTPVAKLSTLANSKQIGREITVSAASSVAQQLTPSVIEDGGMAVEVPSLVVPYLIEYPPSRTISEFLKMLPLDPKEIKELEEASKKKALLASNSSSTSSQSNNPYYSGSGRPRAIDRWGAYFDSSLGKFFSEIGLSLAKEWVQTDLVRSQQRKADKEGRSSRDRTVEVLVKGLNDTKEKNEPYHFSLMKCVHCNFKTESIHVMNRHYDFPHEHHMEFKCNFCTLSTRIIKDIIFHMEAEHGVVAKVERPICFFQCPLCDFEDNSRAKVSKHTMKCAKKFVADRNLAPTSEFDPPAKRAKVYPIIPHGVSMLPVTSSKLGSTSINQQLFANKSKITLKPKDLKMSIAPNQGAYRTLGSIGNNVYYRSGNMVYSQSNRAGSQVYVPSTSQPMLLSSSSSTSSSNQIYQVLNSTGQLMSVGSLGQVNNQRFTILPTATSNSTNLSGGPTPVALVPNIASASSGPRSVLVGGSQRLQPPKPNISITPITNSGKTSVLQQRTRLPTPSATMAKLGAHNASSFVVCEICDGYIKDLEQLRTHMQWIHKVKIHPKMIFNRPPLNCQKCQFRFFTDQGLERHLLGAHGLVTSSMQENANKGQDSGRCTICGKVFQWKLLAHMSKDHNMILKPAHLSYKCTVCAATFGMYKLFETHVYQAHSTVAKRVLDAPDDKKDCSVCGMSFDGRVGEFSRHWRKEHLKSCHVKLCRVDKCEKCLSQSACLTSLNEGDESDGDIDDCVILHDNSVVSDAESVGAETTTTSTPTTSSGGSAAAADSAAARTEAKKPVVEQVKKKLDEGKSEKIKDTVAKDNNDDDDDVDDDDDEEEEDDVVVKTDLDRVSDSSLLNSDKEKDKSKSTTATVVEDGDDDETVDEEEEEEETALDMEVESHDVEHHSQDSIHTDEDDDNDELIDEEEQATSVF